MKNNSLIFIGIGVLVLGFLGYGTYAYTSLLREHKNLSLTSQELGIKISTLENTLTEKDTELALLRGEKEELEDDLRDEKERNDSFEEQIEEISGTVGVLDKLSKTDEELLQKYSKVYFLNEHYVPSALSKLAGNLLLNSQREMYIHTQVRPYLEDMIEDARDDGVDLKIVSAYRSFETQNDLKGSYTVTYGSGANAFSADQGYSEHQLGTTVDLTTPLIGGTYPSFETDPGYAWLVKNAYKYGFVLSYPKNNAYYVFEPWHWRFVGEKLAEDLHDDGKYFYDLDQREIDKYLINIFD